MKVNRQGSTNGSGLRIPGRSSLQRISLFLYRGGAIDSKNKVRIPSDH